MVEGGEIHPILADSFYAMRAWDCIRKQTFRHQSSDGAIATGKHLIRATVFLRQRMQHFKCVLRICRQCIRTQPGSPTFYRRKKSSDSFAAQSEALHIVLFQSDGRSEERR